MAYEQEHGHHLLSRPHVSSLHSLTMQIVQGRRHVLAFFFLLICKLNTCMQLTPSVQCKVEYFGNGGISISESFTITSDAEMREMMGM